MVSSRMEKLERALNAIQKQLEDRDAKFTEYQASIMKVLNRLEAQLEDTIRTDMATDMFTTVLRRHWQLRITLIHR